MTKRSSQKVISNPKKYIGAPDEEINDEDTIVVDHRMGQGRDLVQLHLQPP